MQKLATMILLLGSAATAQGKTIHHIDAVYSTDKIVFIDGKNLNGYYYHLRFYPDGAVIGVTSTGVYTDIRRWFHKNSETVEAGTYSLKDGGVCFTLEIKRNPTTVYPPYAIGPVEHYCGHFDGSDFVAHTHSLINGHDGDEVFHRVWENAGNKNSSNPAVNRTLRDEAVIFRRQLHKYQRSFTVLD